MIVIGVLILILVLLNFLGMVDGGVPRPRQEGPRWMPGP